MPGRVDLLLSWCFVVAWPCINLDPTQCIALQPPRYFWQIYELFNIHDAKFDGVSFSAMAQQFPKVVGLFVVVAFGSSLDVAAIQADSPEPLDYNHELKTVGEPVSGLLTPH
jgi:hypothetical protein